MKTISISISPNMQLDDLKIVWLELLRPWSWRNTSPMLQAENTVAGIFHSGEDKPSLEAVLTSSGRAAIYQTLLAYGIGPGDEVIVQAFTCLAVPAAVAWTGARPVFADIEGSTYNLDPLDVKHKISRNTKAIIIQHTFGLAGRIADLQKIAKDNDLILIEDCAHGLGGRHEQKLLGTFGDAAILSFGRDKTISSVFGGAVISSNVDIISKIRLAQRALPLPPRWWVMQQLLHPLLTKVCQRYYFKYAIGKYLLVLAQKMHLISRAISRREKSGLPPAHLAWRFSPALAALLINQCNKLSIFTKHRQKIASEYANAQFLPPDLIAQLESASWLRVPIRVKSPVEFLRNARVAGMLLGDWYSSPVVPFDVRANKVIKYSPWSCPQAEEASRTVVNLPTYPLLTAQDTQRVIFYARQEIVS